MGVVDAGVRRVASAARMPPTEEGGARRPSRTALCGRPSSQATRARSAARRALCALDGVVPVKELRESYAAARVVRRAFPDALRVAGRVGAGAGLLGWWLLLLGDDAARARARARVRRPRGAARGARVGRALVAAFPEKPWLRGARRRRVRRRRRAPARRPPAARAPPPAAAARARRRRAARLAPRLRRAHRRGARDRRAQRAAAAVVPCCQSARASAAAPLLATRHRRSPRPPA